MQKVELIDSVKFPTTNIYYESDSADGFAFLGYARAKVGLNYNDCYHEMIKRNFKLNAKRKILQTGINVSRQNNYVYTIWVCIEFLKEINDLDTCNKLMNLVKDIGEYKNGMVRYCNEEIYYEVPNVTSSTALLYSMFGNVEKSNSLVKNFISKQSGNNWNYYILLNNKRVKGVFEDSYHLAMILYHLREIEKINKIELTEPIHKIILELKKLNKKKIDGGSIGWGVPMLCLSVNGLDNELYEKSFNLLVKESIFNSNFRVRSIAAWALAKLEI